METLWEFVEYRRSAIPPGKSQAYSESREAELSISVPEEYPKAQRTETG